MNRDSQFALRRMSQIPMASIKDVRTSLGVTARALRYYDSRGLVAVERDRQNFRVFSSEARRELEIVVRLRSAGVTIEEIRRVLEASRRSGARGLRTTAIDSLSRRLDRLSADRLRAEQALVWLQSITASAEDDAAPGPGEAIKIKAGRSG